MALVLVVEDAYLTALEIQRILEDAGHDVLGPAGRVNAALRLLEQEQPDVAVLDVNLGEEKVYPVAEMLMEQQTPFFFLTAYEASDLPEAMRGRPVLSKPVLETRIISEINSVLSRDGRQSN